MITRIKNFFLCLKYPFLKSRNVFTDKFCGYEFTRYDEIPEGWQKAFGKQFLKDLKAALIKDKLLYKFRFTQIKEKYGTLRLYNFGAGKESNEVICKYELLSRGYCIDCGKPAKYCSNGWIEYYCEDCIKPYNYTDEELKELRLTADDIPQICTYNKDTKQSEYTDVKDKYGIDFKKLWDIK